MAKLILLTGNAEDCPPCKEAEAVFRERWAEEIASDEAIVANMDEDEEAYEFWATHELPNAPVIVVTTDGGKLIDILNPMEITEEQKQASPVAAETEQAPIESSG
ncbi:hypothetical protein ES703_108323 [subsurface metagenome]